MPTPPTMMTMNAVTITEWPISGLTETSGAVSAPATPASPAPMNMAMRAVWLIEMPWREAASGSWALARSAHPKRVFLRNSHSAARSTIAAITT